MAATGRVKRWQAQVASAALHNAYIPGFLKGTLYQGDLKHLCVPGFNCYSCPGAVGACPIGALQAVAGSPGARISLYVLGFLGILGALAGRWICGWICPFGALQDLLYRIRVRKPGKALKFFRTARWTKYVLLASAVLLLPAWIAQTTGLSIPVYCKYICPAGTLEGGIPLTLADPALRSAVGPLFSWKMLLLLITVGASILFSRPFCKVGCPLGAFYSLFNRVSPVGLTYDSSRCRRCGVCVRRCGMGVDPRRDPDHLECIRCGECARACPGKALHLGIRRGGTGVRCTGCKEAAPVQPPHQ
ncbi:MAG TPA: 4Fe-4S ferredoxin [Clostridiales bacterium]|nr:4Fe-4S ferredoxin [Clostridiales bacterium]